MSIVAERAVQLLETKVIRHVRTEAGVRRYKQPIGSIIMNDSLLVGLTDITPAGAHRNNVTVQGANGKKYNIDAVKPKSGSNHFFVAREQGSGKIIYKGPDQVAAYAHTAKHVQEEAGIDTRVGGSFGSSKRREGWSENQVQGASDEIASWANSMESDGSGELQSALYEIADQLGEGYSPHRDLRVARHQLEQLRPRARKLDEELSVNDWAGENALEANLNSAIAAVITEGKLPKKYDAEVEAAYAEEALKNATANAGKPRPLKTSEIGQGMWIRSTNKQGDVLGDWFKVTDVGEQSSTPGRSRIIRGNDRNGKRVQFYRQGPRDYWETVGDATGLPAYQPPPEPAPENVSKPVHRLRRGDYTTITGTDANGDTVTDTGYVLDDVLKDNWSTTERQKNPVYPVKLGDDKKGNNSRTVLAAKGTVSGPQTDAEEEASTSETGYAGLRVADSEYEGYGKLVHDDGRVFYVNKDKGKTVVYDADDNELFRGDLESAMEYMSAVPETETSLSPSQRAAMANPTRHLTEAESEYDGYEKFTGLQGEPYYIRQSRGKWIAYDADDNELFRRDDRTRLLADVSSLAAGVDTDTRAGEINAGTRAQMNSELPFEPMENYPNIAVYPSEYEGYEKYKGRNGETYYVAKEGRNRVVYDENDNKLFETTGMRTVFEILDQRAGESVRPTRDVPVAEVPRAEVQSVPLKRLKSKFDGWKRFRLPDGRVVDTGQATDDDNRWYATGPGAWEEIIVDGDSEEEMMDKLRAVAAPTDTPVSFSPSNTDVTPKRSESPVVGMTAEQYERSKRNVSQATRDAILGTGNRQGHGRAGGQRMTREDWAGRSPGEVLPKDEASQRADDEAEMAAAERIRRSAAQGNTIDIASGTAADIGQPGNSWMPEGLAARSVHSLADEFEPATPTYVSLRRIGRELDERQITTEEADRDLGRLWVITEDMGARQKIRQLSDSMRNHDNRTREQIREDAKKKRAQVLQESREEANRINQQVRETLSARAGSNVTPVTSPAGSKLQQLDLLLPELTRNNKPLTNADSRQLNMYQTSQGRPQRLIATTNRNLANRLGRVAPNDEQAYEALQDRATENYLNGMTHAAAWKEAIEAAEKIKTPDHYTSERATRNGNGEVAVMRKNPDGSVDEVAVYRPNSYRNLWKSKQEALGRMSQENQKARVAATRAVPVSGSAPTPDSPVTASTVPANSPEARAAESLVNGRTVSRGDELDTMTEQARIANLQPFMNSGPNYSRGAREDVVRHLDAKRKGEDDAAEAWLISAEENAGLRPRGAYNAHQNERSREATERARQENREMAIATQAAVIDEASARRLAQQDPGRFMRVVGYRYFKMGKDLRKKENAQQAAAWQELQGYADILDTAKQNGTLPGAVQNVLMQIRVGHAGMMGVGRTMMTIRKVLNEEYGK